MLSLKMYLMCSGWRPLIIRNICCFYKCSNRKDFLKKKIFKTFPKTKTLRYKKMGEFELLFQQDWKTPCKTD